jgi:UDP-N-acetyl-D-galactosamine dehydrogenase
MSQKTIAVIGLGYVGLPLAVEFGKQCDTLGFDINQVRINELQSGQDHTLECSPQELQTATYLRYSSNVKDLQQAQIFIVTVPTPVDTANRPDMTPLVKASETVGKALKAGDIVIYESTVYPGATEEVCVPALEKVSGLKFNQDFFCGYSPERINPGDKEHRLPAIKKVTSGSTPEVAEVVDQLYKSIITAGTHKTSSIKVAEAAKVIENTQRDLNIALMNELAIIFEKIGIDTANVLQAAGTKWNFLNFKPGLVGGHCIGVDPYYITHKAEMLGYHPQVILAGRRINDSMGKYIAEQTIKQMIASGRHIKGARINIMGLTFKEDCADLRNSKVIDIIRELESFGIEVYVNDPEADPQEALKEYGVKLLTWSDLPRAEAIVAAVAHKKFKNLSFDSLTSKLVENGVFVDVKAAFPQEKLRLSGICVWRL